jgi:hypothetical protein
MLRRRGADSGRVIAGFDRCRNRGGLNVTGMATHRASAEPGEPNMKYMLLIYSNDAEMEARPEAARTEITAAYMAYAQAMVQAGVMVAGDRLRPASTATTVRTTGGKPQVLDGPYAETKEQLGGYFLIEAPDLDAALSWAQRCPGVAYGSIEVRPIWPV